MKKFIATTAIGLLATSVAFAGSMTDKQQLSYTVGYKTGQQLKQNQTKVDSTHFIMGIKDGIDGNKPALTAAQMKQVLQNYQQKMLSKIKAAAGKAAATNLAAANKFMAANAKKAGVKTIEPGRQYKVITMGTGPKPAMTDSVKVDYEGSLINGKVFDSSYKRGQPVSFKLNQVIKGWGRALTQMPEGSIWMLYIAPKLAYGARGAMGAIGPNEALIFKVHLIKIQK